MTTFSGFSSNLDGPALESLVDFERQGACRGRYENAERWRLAVMMALVYAVQGSFWPLLAVHLADLGIGGRGRGWIFATLAIGSMAVPLGAGQLVDRLMATQRLLALIYAVGHGAAGGRWPRGWSAQAGWMFVVFLAYWCVDRPGVQPEQLAGDAQPGRSGPRVRLGAALGDGRLDDRRLGRLAGDGGFGVDAGGPGCV